MMKPERIEELLKVCEAATERPWRASFKKIDRGKDKGKEICSGIFIPIEGQRYGSKAVVFTPSWNEFDGGIWEAWIGGTKEDFEFVTTARTEFPTALKELREARAWIKEACCQMEPWPDALRDEGEDEAADGIQGVIDMGRAFLDREGG